MNVINSIRAQADTAPKSKFSSTKAVPQKLSFSKLNEQTTQNIFSKVTTVHNKFISILPYLILDAKLAFPDLNFFEADTAVSRLLLQAPSALAQLAAEEASKTGHGTFPRVIAMRDDHLTERLQVLGDGWNRV